MCRGEKNQHVSQVQSEEGFGPVNSVSGAIACKPYIQSTSGLSQSSKDGHAVDEGKGVGQGDDKKKGREPPPLKERPDT